MYGTIVDMHITKKLGVRRGFAFVQYKQVHEAEFLIKLNPKIVIGARRVFLAWARKFPNSRSQVVMPVFRVSASVVQLRVAGKHLDRGQASS